MKKNAAIIALALFGALVTIPAYAAGIDLYTKLAIHSDDLNWSTNFVDSSASSHTIGFYGGVHHSTDSAKFGASAIRFDGSGDYLTVPDSADWDFGSGDFTIDFWANNLDPSLGEGIYSVGLISRRDVPVIQAFTILKDEGRMRFRASSSGAAWDVLVDLGTFDTGWHHYAVVRHGDVFTGYKDGIATGSAISVIALMDENSSLAFGKYQVDFNGYLDEIRISKGIARWTSNFVPPGEPYGNCEADYNHDGIVDKQDLLEKQRDVLDELKSWTENCWSQGLACN